MLSKTEKKTLRSALFRHLDGIVTCPSAYVLYQKGVTEYLLEHRECTLSNISREFHANEGYLNVALRTLSSQGWLHMKIDPVKNEVTYSVNEKSTIAFKAFQLYQKAFELLVFTEQYNTRKFEKAPFLKLEEVYGHYQRDFANIDELTGLTKAIHQQIKTHIEGIMLGPTAVILGMNNMFHKYFMQTKFRAEEFHSDPDHFGRLLDILSAFGWFEKKGKSYEFTDTGLFFARRASAYGVTVSYIPTLRKLDQLIFGNPTLLQSEGAAIENHVDRAMNVWGSGGAHAAYFKVIDTIVIDMFNKPIQEQPKGILDVGCGNGAFLKHLFSIIENQTLRGQMLEEHPLFLIGVDYNEEALKITRKNLVQADIWAKVIWGDIGNPKALSESLEEKYGIALTDLLNVRTFLDHNRVWEPPVAASAPGTTNSTGAYASKGVRLNNNDVYTSLKEHFGKWAPYINQFGLLLIELHTSPPELVAKNLGHTAATAYDATHGYSDQYIIEIDEYMRAMKEIGLLPQENSFRKFPNSELATVSINLFKPQ
jgi:SAM-dependent methyltransferase